MRVVCRCPVDGRGFEVVMSALPSSREAVVAMLEKFGAGHEECARGAELPAASRPHRCGVCGVRLLFGARCPLHPGSWRVEWTPVLATVFEDVASARSRGEKPVAPVAQANEYSLALRLHTRWTRAA